MLLFFSTTSLLETKKRLILNTLSSIFFFFIKFSFITCFKPIYYFSILNTPLNISVLTEKKKWRWDFFMNFTLFYIFHRIYTLKTGFPSFSYKIQHTAPKRHLSHCQRQILKPNVTTSFVTVRNHSLYIY